MKDTHRDRLDGDVVGTLLRARRLLQPERVSADLRTITHEGGRDADVFYRDRWSHDRIVRSTLGVNCTGSCSWKLTSTIERCLAEGRIRDLDPEIVTVSAWSLVHGLAALLISGRLSDRISEQDSNRLAAAVSNLFVESVLDAPDPS